MMDNEKKYNEALEQAKKELATCGSMDCDAAKLIFRLFPQLHEREDERMMREFNDWLCEEIECRTNDLRDEKDRRTLNMLCYILTKVKDWLEKQKEQKPTEKPDLVAELKHHLATTPKEQLEKEWDDLKEWGNVGPTVQEFLYGKPAEWSEEDENNRLAINKAIWEYDEFSQGDATKLIQWLKSLRPSWKPSEEDIKMLEHIIGQYETGNKNSKVMGYLPRVEELNFLKKVLSKWKN